MPKYKNDSTENIIVLDANGKSKQLAPGETSETIRYYDITDLTKLSDEPFINIVAAYHIESFSVAESRVVVLTSPDIAKIRIQKAEGLINIYLQSLLNTPPILESWTSGDYPVDIIIDGRCDQIVIESINPTGSIQIMELKNR